MLHLPELPDTAGRVFSCPLVGHHNELHLVSNLEDFSSLNLGHVEE